MLTVSLFYQVGESNFTPQNSLEGWGNLDKFDQDFSIVAKPGLIQPGGQIPGIG